MEHSPAWEANSSLAGQEMHFLCKPTVHYRIYNDPPPVRIPWDLKPSR
jgi:hypothetical protein